jgi:DNA-directed RNA polymerase specialized sigma24 family protein
VKNTATVELEEAPALTVPSNAIASLQMRDLEAAIGKLPQEQRSVILLVGLEGMSYDEVAAIVGVPVGTVRSRLSRGPRRLIALSSERCSVHYRNWSSHSRCPQQPKNCHTPSMVVRL